MFVEPKILFSTQCTFALKKKKDKTTTLAAQACYWKP